jgi:hypothetical protein
MLAEHSNAHDRRQIVLGHTRMLREWRDRVHRLTSPRPLPVRLQFRLVSAAHSPSNQPQRTGVQATRENGSVQGDGCTASTLCGVEVWDAMFPLVPVHIDDNSVELADARHSISVCSGARSSRRLAASASSA